MAALKAPGKKGAPAFPRPFDPYAYSIFRNERLCQFWPLDEHEAALQRLVKPELLKLARVLDPVKVEMPEHQVPEVVSLNDRETRARHLLGLKAGALGESADEPARERRFAGAELTRQRNDIASANDCREPPAERQCRGLVGQIENELKFGHALDLPIRPNLASPRFLPFHPFAPANAR